VDRRSNIPINRRGEISRKPIDFSDNGIRWRKEIGDCASFSQEFGIHYQAKRTAGGSASMLFQNWKDDLTGRAGKYGTPQNDNVISLLSR
jgi:hypothetical protein